MAALADVADVARTSAVQPDVKQKTDRGRARTNEGKPLAEECLQFWRGNQYVYRNRDNILTSQATLYGSEGLEPHRQRTTRNMILDVVAQETSAATQRIPGYEITPSTTDPEDIGAANISKRIADYGYEQWRIDDMSVRGVEYAVIQGEAFAWPYFDNTIGTPLSDTGVCTGDVRVRIFGRNQVGWEPGVLFDDSRWLYVDTAEPIDRVKKWPGYLGGELQADTIEASQDKAATNLVRVTHYLERPSAEYREGRHLVIANDRRILPDASFPCRRKGKGGEDEYVDEPALIKLSYFLDPESERDMGLVEHTLDPQRTINDCVNKGLEWKNHALIPQILAPAGSISERRTDKPGAVINYIPINGMAPTWAPVPSIPPELRQMKEEAQSDISLIAAQTVIPSQVESGDAIQALIEKDANRRREFISRLAKWHARIMRYCLYLVQNHYTEERTLMINGEFGVEPLSDFLGAHLRGQCDVTVLPASLEPKTRESIAAQVMGFADRGWITPEKAMAAINAGTAGNLVESYERDISRSRLVIRKLRAFGVASGEVPTPRPFDNLDVLTHELENFMKSNAFDASPDFTQEACMQYWNAIQQLMAEKAAKDAAAQQQQAMALGAQNAARPGAPPAMPSAPSIAA